MRGVRASAAAATIVAVVLGGVGSAVAQTTAAPAATSISIRALQPSIAPGKASTIVGDLEVEGASPAGRPVALEARAAGEHYFTAVRTATTTAQGGLSLRVRPEVTTRYRWSYEGADDARPRLSGIVVVQVRTTPSSGPRRATTLAIRAARPVATADGKATVAGSLLSGKRLLRGRYVVLLARTSSKDRWERLNRHRTGRRGGVVFTVRPSTRTSYRIAFAGTARLKPVTSGVVEIGVRQTVSISATPRQIDRGDSTVIAGTVTHSGSPVAGVRVDLLARVVGSTKPWAVVGTATTSSNGSVSIEHTPAKTTRYRLRAQPVTGLPRGSSAAVEVVVRASETDYGAPYAWPERTELGD